MLIFIAENMMVVATSAGFRAVSADELEISLSSKELVASERELYWLISDFLEENDVGEVVATRLISHIHFELFSRAARSQKASDRPGIWKAELIIPPICNPSESQWHYVKVNGFILSTKVSVTDTVLFRVCFVRRESAKDECLAQDGFEEAGFSLTLRVVACEILEETIHLEIRFQADRALFASASRKTMKTSIEAVCRCSTISLPGDRTDRTDAGRDWRCTIR